ncbi:run domain Beclin-1-interacting and cysteine-rich domain-containing protein-like isoform X2 [Gigantopelta aegis]|uniref:run domain Beclin-1-interacting and cysteine-rich domain-containing protein-like isoform X2 n=1 Tax=Gigantopelta aegis TaxID=1735272 RepID=UPI001B88B18E|nr:run domain Beclin-1-interacting and cysteine-rich domain-containing protein-like isoform X2 [Gigantopelta aegis]
MADDEQTDEEITGAEHGLLIALKTTIEGLLATHSINVWNTYGGLNRVCQCVENILRHGLKSLQDHSVPNGDFWPFVRGLKWINPVLAPSIERISRLSQGCDEDSKGRSWLRESLFDHALSEQLRLLSSNQQHLATHYREKAFLRCPAYLQSMIICLKAIEQNKVALLADIDPTLLSQKCKKRCHARSASLPINNVSRNHTMRTRDRGDMYALAPPFSSPNSCESVLCTSDEHAVPVNIGSSPDESRNTAKHALRTVLNKSGGESLPLSRTTPSFSFYDRIHSDPLLNMEFVPSPPGQEKPLSILQENDTKYTDTTSKKKKTISRSQSYGHSSSTLINKNGNSYSLVSEKRGLNISNNSDDVTDSVPNYASVAKTRMANQGMGHKRSQSDMSPTNHGGSSGTNIQSHSKLAQAASFPSVPQSIKRVPSQRCEGLLLPPAQGQSLRSYLSSQDFHTCANLDKENAHFSISEALIAAIEQMKWNHIISPSQPGIDPDEDSDEEIQQLKQRIRIRRRERMKERARGFPACSDGKTDNSSNSSDEFDDFEISLSESIGDERSNLFKMSSGGLSLSMASLYSDAELRKSNAATDKPIVVPDNMGSADTVAISLLKKFSEKQLPKASDLEWLVSEQDAPQALLPLPNSYPVSPDDGENADLLMSGTMTRLRGNLEWAPPRAQIIFNIHPAPKRAVVLARQNYRCAGCGMKVEPAYMKRFRYCEYLGKYFCQCCHGNAIDHIPGRILQKWDFTKYYVSNFSRDLLARIQGDPLFSIQDINPVLYRRVKNLERVRDCRKQLHYLKSFIKICKSASRLYEEMDKLPRHWFDDVNMFSLQDLLQVKNGEMVSRMQIVVSHAVRHIKDCEFCQGLGFICEICHNNKVIYPFQLHSVSVCSGCHATFHRQCFDPGKCPKCVRIEARKRTADVELSSSPDSGETTTIVTIAEPSICRIEEQTEDHDS